MSIRYSKLLSPIKIGNLVLKNRMTATPSTPHYLQGLEPYPTEKFITHFANRAKNGAAVVTVNHLTVDQMGIPGVPTEENPPLHFNMVDMSDPTCQNYLCQLIDAIHFYGAQAMAYLPTPDVGIQPPDNQKTPEHLPPPRHQEASKHLPPAGDGITTENMTSEQRKAYINEIVDSAVVLQKLGFDMFSVHSAYRRCTHAQFLSPITNSRTDSYGGSVENRSRFTLELFKELRRRLGQGAPLEIVMSVSEPGGWTVQDTIEFARQAQGIIDILHLRSGETDPQHPTGFTSTPENPAPYLAEIAQVTTTCKKEGIAILIGASAGFHDPDFCEQTLAEEKCDLICMARSWISDPAYGKKIYAGRGEDVVPCIRCNKCHGSDSDYFRSFCSVNPILGLEDKIDRMIAPPERSKAVAVIGGGPAGMESALVLARRGHRVTIFEKEDRLGGALCHADFASFKWPLKSFKDYQIRKLAEYGVEVCLNTEASPSMLGNFDTIVVAIGAEPVLPQISGINSGHVHTAAEVYGKDDILANKIAVIGGGEIGVETGMYLVQSGHDVTVLEMGSQLAPDAPKSHYRSMLVGAYEALDGFHSICSAQCIKITKNGVLYLDERGKEQAVFAENVILSVGTRARSEKAMAFYGVATETVMVGDCLKAGNLQKAMRSALAAASQI